MDYVNIGVRGWSMLGRGMKIKERHGQRVDHPTQLFIISIGILISFEIAVAAQKDEIGSLLSGKSPRNFAKLALDERKRILSTAAEQGYLILSIVPDNGLVQSEKSIEEVISVRKWLSKTNDVFARTLALELQRGVDSAVLNELYRREKKEYSHHLEKPFKGDSLNQKLVDKLLGENGLDEVEELTYALSLDTEIAGFCREKGYDANDFISGKIFGEAPYDLFRISLIATVDGNEVKIEGLQDLPYENSDLIFTMFWGNGILIDSREDVALFYMPRALRAIQEARDVRMIAEIYASEDGLGDANDTKLNKTIVETASAEYKVLSKVLEKGRKIRLDDTWPTGSRDIEWLRYESDLLLEKIGKRLELEEEDRYKPSLALWLAPFISDEKMLPLIFANEMSGNDFTGRLLDIMK